MGWFGVAAGQVLQLAIVSRKPTFLVVLLLVLRGLKQRLWRGTKRDWRPPLLWLKCSSQLAGSVPKYLRPHRPRETKVPANQAWRGFCCVCRRPLDLELCSPPDKPESPKEVRGKYAFVITLWGSSRSYVLGALVLGHSIRSTGSKHALVCLHTDDVPEAYIDLLSRVWDCRVIQHVESSKRLCWPDQADRFEKVFTKLNGLGLVEFEKIVMMDIDMLVVKNIDDLFDLPAPAAMKRGMTSMQWWGQKHGEAIDGRPFFCGGGLGKYSWGQGTGINAGVMLWRPDQELLDAMLEEVAVADHPAHVRSNGPEQDFLSRYWADAPWTQVGVEYNYQLHQMFYGLNPNTINSAERIKMAEDPQRIKIIHYSGEPLAKPWCRLLHEQFKDWWPDRTKDADYLASFAQEFRGYWLWVRRDRSAWDKHEELCSKDSNHNDNFRLGSDGEIYRIVGERDENYPGTAAGADARHLVQNLREGDVPVLVQMPQETLKGAMKVLEFSLEAWFSAFDSLQRSLGIDIVAALGGVKASEEHQTWKQSWFANGSGPHSVMRPSSTEQPKLRYRRQGGWLHEQVDGGGSPGSQAVTPTTAKATVCCGARDGARFVMFNEPEGAEPFFPGSEEVISGLFVKIIGRDARAFSLEDGVSAIAIWAEGVKPGDVVLLAIVDLDPQPLREVLAALEPLGVPQGPFRTEFRALAAAGIASGPWDCTHASVDMAYAAIPVSS